MIVERYVVYRVLDSEIGTREELAGFRTEWRAIAYMDKQPFATTLDWLCEEITRDGREVLDAEADIAARDGHPAAEDPVGTLVGSAGGSQEQGMVARDHTRAAAPGVEEPSPPEDIYWEHEMRDPEPDWKEESA